MQMSLCTKGYKNRLIKRRNIENLVVIEYRMEYAIDYDNIKFICKIQGYFLLDCIILYNMVYVLYNII